MIIVLATHNKDKQKELLPLLKPLGIGIKLLDDFPQIGEIAETGSTLRDNALIKARTVHRLTGLPALADDTGLEVACLNGQPGVRTGRYAGENATYAENVTKLLQKLKTVPESERSARFLTVIAYVDSERELIENGVVEGRILNNRKGVGGFGYDPVFYIPQLDKTFAEMTSAEKSKISHRGRAFRKMKKLLEGLVVTQTENSPQLNSRS
ncbi:MAG: RdgB/HAM1 family non-canonical purine NTP pyrophosphatase [FCB group bacterium]|nr:RdgB/HAM1 family non-canonical purine NTP pyrophosphatase [FCB group bacterium]